MLYVSQFGVVIIGRNEGERFKRCLASLAEIPKVYVDSGSTDGSVDYARSEGALCVELDVTRPFTAARARNAGFKALCENYPSLQYVMFVDGDCEVQPGWFPQALEAIGAAQDTAVVCGRRRERFPNASIYNLLCDIEWDTPIGETKACGGDALYRVEALNRAGGFDDGFIAGEEPELCFRIRQQGQRVVRIDAEMTLHDADMTRFPQWWKRSERSGYAFVLNALKHGGANRERFKYKEVTSIMVWGGGFFASILLSLLSLSLLPLSIYLFLVAVQVARMTLRRSVVVDGAGESHALRYAFFVMLGKIPQSIGVLRGYLRSKFDRQHTLVEYK